MRYFIRQYAWQHFSADRSILYFSDREKKIVIRYHTIDIDNSNYRKLRYEIEKNIKVEFLFDRSNWSKWSGNFYQGLDWKKNCVPYGQAIFCSCYRCVIWYAFTTFIILFISGIESRIPKRTCATGPCIYEYIYAICAICTFFASSHSSFALSFFFDFYLFGRSNPSFWHPYAIPIRTWTSQKTPNIIIILVPSETEMCVKSHKNACEHRWKWIVCNRRPSQRIALSEWSMCLFDSSKFKTKIYFY